MIAFPEMLVDSATKAGIKVPSDVTEYDKNTYPHWYVFCTLQLGQPMPYWSVHYDNAKVIAGISDDKLKKLTLDEVVALGFNIAFQIP